MNELIEAASSGATALATRLDSARAFLAECRTDFERLQIRDHAKAVEAAAAILKRTDIQVEASILVQDAERAIAKANPPKTRKETGRGHKVVVPDNDFKPQTVRAIRAAHSKVDDDAYEAIKAKATEEQTPLTRKAVKESGTKKRPRSGNASHDNDDEWYTPPGLVEACRNAMGGIDLDPASNAIANDQVIRAERWYGKDDNGLMQAWSGRVFLNPPYSKSAGKREFIAKLAAEYAAGNIEQACVILSYDFSPSWFDPLRPIVDAICLMRGRVKFYKDHPGDGHDPALGTSAIYLGRDVMAFKQAFDDFGLVVTPLRNA